MTVVALALIAAGQLRLSEYLVEEALTVLLGVAALLLLSLLTAIAFLLLWRGASLAFGRLRARTEGFTTRRSSRLRAGHSTSHPLPSD